MGLNQEMNNQLIKKEELTVWGKIKQFFKKIFSRKNKNENVNTENLEIPLTKENIKKTDFEQNLKVDISSTIERREIVKNFIRQIEEKPELVEELPEDKVDKLIIYYEKVTKEKDEKIKRLKASMI